MLPRMAKKATPWQVFEYERDMFLALRGAVFIVHSRVDPKVLKNALAESHVLHARNLSDILLSHKNSPDNDDVRLKDLLPGFKSNHTKQLRKAYHDGPKDERPHWIFNKMLAHPTNERYDGYDYGPALTRLAEHTTKLLTEIAAEREKLGI